MPDWTAKDIENLVIGGKDIDSHVAIERDAAIKYPADFSKETINYIRGVGSSRGLLLPFSKLQGKVYIREGELSLVAGYNGDMKSMLLGQFNLGFMAQNSATCIASLEMQPASTLARMIYQAATQQDPTDKMIMDFFYWATEGNRLKIFHQVDTVSPERAINLAKYCGEVMETKVLVLDSLMMCGVDPKDTAKQKILLNELSAVCKGTGLHIFLVTHLRKPSEATRRPPNRYDIHGGSEITNIAHNIFITTKNRRKQEEKRKPIEKREQDYEKMPDQWFTTEKQREARYEGTIPLWFDERSLQMKEHQSANPVEYWKNFGE